MCNRISPVPSILSSRLKSPSGGRGLIRLYIIFAPSSPKISALIRGMSASNVFLTLASNVLSHVVFPLLENHRKPLRRSSSRPSIFRRVINSLERPASVVIHALVPSLTRSPLYTFFRLVCGIEWYNSNLAISSRLARLTPRSCLYCGDFETSPSFSLAVFNTSSIIIRSLAIKTLIRAAFPVVDRSIFFFTDTRDSFRSYSLLIFCFSLRPFVTFRC